MSSAELSDSWSTNEGDGTSKLGSLRVEPTEKRRNMHMYNDKDIYIVGNTVLTSSIHIVY